MYNEIYCCIFDVVGLYIYNIFVPLTSEMMATPLLLGIQCYYVIISQITSDHLLKEMHHFSELFLRKDVH